MKIYKVKVNGKLYEVELEAVEEVKDNIKTEKEPNAILKEVKAPIGGKIIDIKVKPGDNVKKGDTLLIVEAMKLENEIKSPADGVINEIFVTKGATVANKEVLLTISE